MDISKTDLLLIIRLLSQSERFFEDHAVKPREMDQPRLLRKMIKKLRRKLESG